MPYSAGTAFLQIVPSFLGVEAEMRNQLRKIGLSLDNEIEKGIGDGFVKGRRVASEEGARAGSSYGGAFGDALRRRLDASLKALPKAKIEGDISPLERELGKVRAELETIRDAHVKLEVDDRTALARIEAAAARLRDLQRFAQDPGDQVNIASARRQAEALERLVQEARDFGFRAGDNWGGAFGAQARKSVDSALRAMPVIPLKPDSTELDHKISEARARLAELRDVKIGIDMPTGRFLEETARVRAEIASLAHESIDVGTKANLDAAVAKLDEFAKVTAPKKGADAGEATGGAFARAVKERVEAAAKSLPNLHVDADARPAEAKLDELRVRLQELSAKTVGVDVDTTQAHAQILELRAELLELARDKNVEVDVRADAGTAALELGAVLELARQVDRSSPSVKVDASSADKASDSMRHLGSTFSLTAEQATVLVALGPAIGAAIVPAAVAAAGAVASIGAAAIASVGVAVLGLSGVGAAIKAMNQQQQDAAKSAASLDTSQNSLAGALDQVESAERSLANTRRTVAEGAVRAAEQVRSAQQGVVDAERAALEAQKALNGAYEEARRQQEDLAAQLAGNSIAQRQAVLDVADAKAKLDAVLSNPHATQTEREQARITYDQRKLQLDNLRRDGGRLAEDQKKADKAGIDGSQQVVAARDRIRTTTEALGKAQQSLADAQRGQKDQQIQGAFQIAQAAQGVVAAQRSVEQASIRAGVAGGAALNNLKTALDNLSPAGREFARFIFSLKPELDGLRATAAEGLLPGMEAGIRAVLPLLPQVRQDVGDLATELGHVAEETGKSIGSPYWSSFIHQLLSQSVPALDLASHIIGSLAMGLAGLVKQLLPFGQDVGGGLLSWADKFAQVNNTLGANPKFQQFLQFVRTEGPQAAETIGELVEAAIHLAAAIAPLGSPTLTILRLLAQVFNLLPLSLLQNMVQAAVLFGFAIKAWNLINMVREAKAAAEVITVLGVATNGSRLAMIGAAEGGAGLLGRALSALTTVTTGARVAMIDAAEGGAGKLGRALAGVKGGAATAGEGIASLAGSIGPAGIFGLAVAGAVLLIEPLVSMFQEQARHEREVKTQTDSLAGALRGLAGNYAGATKSSQDYFRNLVETDPKFRDFILNASKLGISVNDITAALHGNKDALNQVDTAYDTEIATLEQFLGWKRREGSDVERTKAQWDAYNKVVKEHPELINASTEEIQKYINAAKSERDATAQTADALAKQNAALTILGVNASGSSLTLQKLNDVMGVLRDSTASASDKIGALKDAEDALNGSTKSVADSQHAFASGSLQLRDALAQANTEGVNARNITDDYTRAGNNINSVLGQQVQNAMDVYNATLAQTGSVEQANAAYDAYLAKIQADIDKSPLDQAEKAKVRDRLQEIVTTQGKIPTDPKILEVQLRGDGEVLSKMDALAILQRSLTFGVSLDQAKKDWDTEKRISANFGHLATGGPIFGPGTGTSDSVPAWGPIPGVRYRLSDGEHVLTAAEVKAAGGHEVIERLRKLILAGLFQPRARYPGDGSQGIAFAGGGPVVQYSHVGNPFGTDVSHTKLPTEAQIRAAAMFGPAYNGPLSDRARFAMTWAKAQEGKPYIWASAGPVGYDCSGIQSGIFNILSGRPIYNHTFSTFDEGRYLNKPGWGMYTAGWTNPGERGPGGNSVGHTAGKIGNLLVESRGGDGVVIGPRVTPLSSFAHLAHFAAGGPVKSWLMDRGGMLQRGWNPPIYNATGAPEPVLSPAQWEDISNAAKRTEMSGPTYNFAFRDTTLDRGQLRAMQDRDAALARVGRAR